MGVVQPDLDDTVSRAGRPADVARKSTLADMDDTLFSRPRVADLDDTVARGSVVPHALVEPPEPEPRPLPLVESLADILPTRDEDREESVAGPLPLHARLSDGTVVPLDVAVYVGRKPSVPRIHVGPAPRLVTLPSPAHEVSATHLELRVVGGSVVASDMRSTNGTVVTLPGAAPRTLIRGESAVVMPGTRIDLGDGAVLDILTPASGDPQ